MAKQVVLLAVLLGVGLVGLAPACIVIPHPPPRPDIRPLYLEARSQTVETTITDQVARTTVTTVLHNPNRSQVEGTFLYPLPPDASVSDFSYWMGDKEMKGELLDRDKARRVYEDIVRQMRDPALLEYDGAGVFKASIFPVPPGGDVKTRLQFTQVLRNDGGVVKYTHAVKLGRTQPNRGDLVISVGIRSKVPIKAVYSPTHQVDVVRKSDTSVSASVELDDTDYAADFQLYYTLADKDFGLNALTHREAGEPGYFMLLLSPKQDWGEREIEGKDLVLALDTSGSMGGKKIEQAKAALKQVLQALRPQDRFGLLTFATEARNFDDKLLAANEANIKRATDYVDKLEAAGSTALNDALVQAAGLADSDGGKRPAMIMFLTDGLPTQGERDAEQIIKSVAKANQTDNADRPDERLARLFLFGVGDDVNTHLLDRLAEGNGGATTYVRPSEDIEAAISGLYAKLSHPVLSRVKLALAGIEAHDLYPARLPDLFVGSQVIVAGRYDVSGGCAVTLTGQAGSETRRYTYEAQFPKESEEHPFVARVWAVRRIGVLLDAVRLHGEDKEIKDEIVRLALKFGIVTPYTSYLVQEDKALRAFDSLSAAQTGAFMRSDAALGKAGQGGAPGMPGAVTAPTPAAPSAAIRQQVGAGAVHAAQSVQALKEGNQAAQGDQTTYRAVGQRTFYFDGEWWLDSAWDKNLPQVQVKAFSPAYFELLKLRPEVAQYLALGQQVKVRFGQWGLLVGKAGVETLDAAQRKQVQQ